MSKIEKEIIDFIYDKIKEAAPYIKKITKDRKEVTYKYSTEEERNVPQLTAIPLYKTPSCIIYEFLETPDVKNKIVELEYGAMESFLKGNIHTGVFIRYIKDNQREICVVPYHFFLYPLDEAIEKYKESIELEQQECKEQFEKEQQSDKKTFTDCKKELRYQEYLKLKKRFEGKEVK